MTTYGTWALRAAMAGAAALAVVAAFAQPSTGAARAATSWTIFGKNAFRGDDAIQDVTVAPTGSTWGGGYRSGPDADDMVLPVVQHWVKGKFQNVALPSVWRGKVEVMDASSSKNVWAFGDDFTSPYAARWNGSRWAKMALPQTFAVSDAEAFSASNVWAVSSDGKAQRWNGSAWRSANAPVKTTAIDGKDGKLWAVGGRDGMDGRPQPAAARWDGSRWTAINPPAVALPGGEAEAFFTDVTMVSATNAWAVGGIHSEGGDTPPQSTPILAHYVGGKWKVWTNGAGIAFNRVVQDGQGGIHIMQGQWNPTVLHGRNGVWTRTALPRTPGFDVAAFSLERNPVTGTLWTSGFHSPEGDPDDPTVNGTYWRLLAG